MLPIEGVELCGWSQTAVVLKASGNFLGEVVAQSATMLLFRPVAKQPMAQCKDQDQTAEAEGNDRPHPHRVDGHCYNKLTRIDAQLPMLRLVISLFKSWHEQQGQPSEGWVFPNQSGKDPSTFVITLS